MGRVIAALTFVFLSVLCGTASTATTCADPLQCFLLSRVIVIPDKCIDVSGTQLCTSNVKISEITLTDIPSQYSELNPFDLIVQLDNAGAKVSGNYKYGKLIGGSISGSVLMTVSMDVLVQTVPWETYPMPASVGFASCSFPQITVKIDFGNVILDAFSKTLEKDIKEAIVKEVCTTLPEKMTADTKELFADKLDPSLEKLISFKPSVPLAYGNEYVSWNETLIGKLYNIASWFRSSTIFECLQKSHDTTLMPFLPSVVDFLVKKETNGTGVITIPTSKNFSLGILNSTLLIRSVSLYGLDTFKQISLQPSTSSPVSLLGTLALSTLGIAVEMTLHADLETGTPYSEELVVKGQVGNVLLSIEMVVAVLKQRLDSLFVDQILMSPTCILSTVEALNVTSLVLDLNVSQLVVTQISGSSGPLETDILRLVNNSIALVTNGFKDLISGVVSGIAQGPARSDLNIALSKMLAGAIACPSHVNNRFLESEDLVKWPQSAILSNIDGIINEQIGPMGINNLLHCVTNGTGGVIVPISNTVVGETLSLRIENIDSWYDFRVLVPMSDSPFLLKNALGFGSYNSTKTAAECRPVSLTLSAAVPTDPSNLLLLTLPDTLVTSQATLLLSDIHVDVDAVLQVSRNAINNLQLGQLSTTGCVASTIQSLQLTDLLVAVSNTSLRITRGDGSAKSFNLNDMVSQLLDRLTSRDALATLNGNIDKKLGQSSQVCANGGVSPDSGGTPSDNNTSSSNWASKHVWAIAVPISIAFALGVAVYLYRYRLKDQPSLAGKSQYSLLMHDKGEAAENSPTSSLVDTTNVEKNMLNQVDHALIRHPRLSFGLRWIVPLLLVINIGIFIYSNSVADAVTVMTTIQFGSYETTVQAFSFSFASTVQEMWDAKVYFLAVIICGFTGIWPYVKLLAMGASWILPPKSLSVDKRYAMLRFVDAYGKYSLVDFYVMVLMLCAFFFEMHLGPPGQQLNITLFTVPHSGFYSFLASTILSLLLGHVVLAAHRHVCDAEFEISSTSSYKKINPPKLSALEQSAAATDCLASYSFQLGQATVTRLGLSQQADSDIVSLRVTKRGLLVICVALCLTFSLVIYGTWVNTFTFSIKGLTGLLLQSNATVDYSYDYVGLVMPIDSGTPTDWRMLTMQACFFVFGVGMPALLCFLVALAWFYPMSRLNQERLFVTAEVVNAWASLDVFCLAILAALFQIRQFATFIVGDKCDGIDAILQAYLDTALDGDDVCFDVETGLLPNSWALFTAALAVFFVSYPSLLLLSECVETRKHKASDFASASVSTGAGAGADGEKRDIYEVLTTDQNGISNDLGLPLLLGENVDDFSNSPSIPRSSVGQPSSTFISLLISTFWFLGLVEIRKGSRVFCRKGR